MSKFFFFFALMVAVAVSSLLYGMQSAIGRNALYELVRSVKDDFEVVVRTLLDGPYADFTEEVATDATQLIGVPRDDGALVFLSGYFGEGPELRLVERDGSIVRKWLVRQEEIFAGSNYFSDPDQFRKIEGFDIHGALMNPDGSIVFSFEYGGMVKLSACGGLIWSLDTATHHSIERAAGGGYWVPGRKFYRDGIRDAFPPFTDTERSSGFREDLILRVSEDGKVLEEKSAVRLLYDAGMEAVLTATGEKFMYDVEKWDGELVHLNKISELTAEVAEAFPQFETGDLVLSYRTYNLIVVTDPDDWSVKWYQVGPWLRQHDPEFSPDGRIVLFNNNGYATMTRFKRKDLPLHSNIMAIDPVTRQTEILYGDGPDQRMASVFRGKVQLLPENGLLITEAGGGRALQVNAEGDILWAYINAVGENRVGQVNEALVYERDYFNAGVFSCP